MSFVFAVIGHILTLKRSLTLIHPSLPMPSFLARHLLNLPDIYCLTSEPAPRPEVEILCVFTSNGSAQQNIDINFDRVFELVCHELPSGISNQTYSLFSPSIILKRCSLAYGSTSFLFLVNMNQSSGVLPPSTKKKHAPCQWDGGGSLGGCCHLRCICWQQLVTHVLL